MNYNEARLAMSYGAVCERIGFSRVWYFMRGNQMFFTDGMEKNRAEAGEDLYARSEWRIVSPVAVARTQNATAQAIEAEKMHRVALRAARESKQSTVEQELAELRRKTESLDADDDDLVRKYNELAASIEKQRGMLIVVQGRMDAYAELATNHGKRLDMLEGNKPQATRLPDGDMLVDAKWAVEQGIIKPPLQVNFPKGDIDFKAESTTVAWPEGSLVWAEGETHRRGWKYVRRRSNPAHALHVARELTLSPADRSALDWEPCE